MYHYGETSTDDGYIDDGEEHYDGYRLSGPISMCAKHIQPDDETYGNGHCAYLIAEAQNIDGEGNSGLVSYKIIPTGGFVTKSLDIYTLGEDLCYADEALDVPTGPNAYEEWSIEKTVGGFGTTSHDCTMPYLHGLSLAIDGNGVLCFVATHQNPQSGKRAFYGYSTDEGENWTLGWIAPPSGYQDFLGEIPIPRQCNNRNEKDNRSPLTHPHKEA